MKKPMSQDEQPDAYDLTSAIPKDVIFKTFLAQNSAQTRYYKCPTFWKEFKTGFPSAKNYKECRVPCIVFTGNGVEYDDILERLKAEFRLCMKDPNWII
jgi:hypothetical protein